MEEGYEVVKELTSFRDVVNHFKETEETSWLLCSTGGWHGTNLTLEDNKKIMKGEHEHWLPGGSYVTVFIMLPESVKIKWGEIKVKNDQEIEWLRKKVLESLTSIVKSQRGNT